MLAPHGAAHAVPTDVMGVPTDIMATAPTQLFTPPTELFSLSKMLKVHDETDVLEVMKCVKYFCDKEAERLTMGDSLAGSQMLEQAKSCINKIAEKDQILLINADDYEEGLGGYEPQKIWSFPRTCQDRDLEEIPLNWCGSVEESEDMPNRYLEPCRDGDVEVSQWMKPYYMSIDEETQRSVALEAFTLNNTASAGRTSGNLTSMQADFIADFFAEFSSDFLIWNPPMWIDSFDMVNVPLPGWGGAPHHGVIDLKITDENDVTTDVTVDLFNTSWIQGTPGRWLTIMGPEQGLGRKIKRIKFIGRGWNHWAMRNFCGKPTKVHGDPLFVRDGVSTHFWIREGSLTPLLLWKSHDGAQMQLAGETYHLGDIGPQKQWFKRIQVTRNGVEALEVIAAKTDDGLMQVKLQGQPITMEELLELGNMNSKLALQRQTRNELISRSSRPWNSMQRNDKLDVLKMDVGGLVLNVTSRRNVIHKHEDELHINFNFASAIPRDATGLLAELAGVRPMSKATEQMIVKKVDLNSKEKQEVKEKEELKKKEQTDSRAAGGRTERAADALKSRAGKLQKQREMVDQKLEEVKQREQQREFIQQELKAAVEREDYAKAAELKASLKAVPAFRVVL